MPLLSSRFGLCLYLLLPNHWVWKMLSPDERTRIKAGDVFHNTKRPDYAVPSSYQGGVGFGAEAAGRDQSRRRDCLQEFLDRTRPSRVLEVGPGSGYLTQSIVNYPSVTSYVAVDLNPAFLKHLAPHLASISRPGFSFELVPGSVSDVPAVPFDAIVLCAVVHHIPDRESFFRMLTERLAHGGRILAIDPTHYALRVLKILRKIMKRGYLSQHLEDARNGRLSTHAMCQLAEYRIVSRRTGLSLSRALFTDQPARVRRWRASGVPLGPLWRWASQEMVVELEHQNV